MEEIVENFCGEETIWDTELGWNTTVPRFTRCFQKTIPIWGPSLFLWLFAPIEAYLIVKHRRNCQSIPYNPYNVSRLTVVLCLLAVNAIQFGYDLLHSAYLPVFQASNSERFLSSSTVADLTSSLLYLLTFGLFTFSIILHRLFGVHTSGVAWIFTFLSVVFALPNVYMFVLFHGFDEDLLLNSSNQTLDNLKETNSFNNSQYQDTFQFVIFSIHFALLFIVFLLTCFADRRPTSCLLSHDLKPQQQQGKQKSTEESNNLLIVNSNDADLQSNSFELKTANNGSRRLLTEHPEEQDDAQVYQTLVEPLINGQGHRQLSTDSSAVPVAEPKDCTELRASFLSCITYWWFNSLAITGFRKSLVLEDLWKLKHEDTTEHVAPRFDRNWQRQLNSTSSAELYVDSPPNVGHSKTANNGFQSPTASGSTRVGFSASRGKKPGTLTALFHTYGLYFVSGASLKLIHDLLQFVSPQLLKIFIEFVSKSSSVEPMWHGFFIAILFFLVSSTQSILLNQYFYIMYQIGMRIRTSLTSAIYRKSLNLSGLSRRETTTGEIINLMSVDAQRFVELIPFINLIWSAPLQIVLTVYFLWMELGPAVLAGLAVMVLMIPLNGVISTYQRRLQIKQMKLKDERVKVINELLNGMRVIKLYAWEVPFIKKVNDIRNTELTNLKYIAYISSVTSFLWTCTPFLVSFMSFAIYVLSSEENILDPKKAFVSLSLFNLLRFPLTMLPQMISSVVTASVSVKRLNRFLNSTQLEKYVKRDEELPEDSIIIEDGTFCWDLGTADGDKNANGDDKNKNKKNKNKVDDVEKKLLGDNDPATAAAGSNSNANENGNYSKSSTPPIALSSINLKVKKGSLVAIVGNVGSGKSSLLSAILGDMERLSGTVSVNGSSSMAYVAQQAWIQNASLRENILFGRKYERNRYRKIIEMCALEPDIAILPGGDETEIGEKGINLSGGQKQRVAIARACYADSDIVLFDDPLSAVDSHVAQHIFAKVISSASGYLQNRTRVMVTNNIALLPDVDQIVVLSNGHISEIGTYQQLMQNSGKFSEFVKEFSAENNNNNANDSTDINDDSGSQPKSPETELFRLRSTSIRSKSESLSEKQNKTQSLQKQKSEDGGNKLIETEHTETGGVKLSIYMSYFRSLTFLWMSLVAVGFIGMQIASVGSNVWLAVWSNDPAPSANITEAEVSLRNNRLAIYGSLGLTQALFILLGSFSMARGTIHSSRSLHLQLLERIMRSPMQFFDTTPLGRIVNRFSKDIDTIDSTIPHTIRGWLLCFLQVISTFILISIEVPIFFVVVLPILLLYYFIQKFYVATSRQLKRLESVTRSPIYSHFGETLSGVSTIRAYGSVDRFVSESNHRVDTNQRCYFPSVISNRWLAVRLEFCGNFIVFFAAAFAVLSRDSFQHQPGFVGLIITYALGVTQTLNWLVRMSSEIETNIVSVERIGEYCENETEREWNRPTDQEPVLGQSWPQQGVIKFDKYSVRYRDGLKLVLNGITIEVNSGEKIGIVGRTGAGKSSLTLSLFRLLEAANGRIVIDNVDISKIGLHELRNKLSIIPQDPVLFSGTIRSNLDPFDVNSDDRLWQALEHSHLKEYVSTLDQGLDYRVAENGENLSVGQRQLICLARALLRKTKILILDEATAAIDLETDSLIQTTIRQEFADCTILTIAHRLNTILDSNRVLVLDQGKVAEFDSPDRLLKDRRSRFYALAKDAGIV